MRKKIYAEVTNGKLFIRTGEHSGKIYDTNNISGVKNASVILVGNTAKTVLRIVPVPDEDITKNEWEFLEKTLPVGNVINEVSYVFDYEFLENKYGDKCVIAVAIPHDYAMEVVRIGTELTGSLHKINEVVPIEYVLIEHFKKLENDSYMLFFPQDNGVRCIYINNNLPAAIGFISTHPSFRLKELERFFKCNNIDLKEAVLISTEPDEYSWLGDYALSITYKEPELIYKNL